MAMIAEIAAEIAALKRQVLEAATFLAKARGRCAARARKGRPCKATGMLRGGRCRNHGGLSTGPKTEDGRARVAEAQRKRWARWRQEQATRQGSPPPSL